MNFQVKMGTVEHHPHNTEGDPTDFRINTTTTTTTTSVSNSNNNNFSHHDNDEEAAKSASMAAFVVEEDDDDMFANCGYNPEELTEALQAEADVLGTRAQTQSSTTTTTASAAAAISSSITAHQPPQMLPDQVREGLKEALAMLPEERRSAYDEAMTRYPQVVEVESPAERFLSVCDYDLWAAADHLALYWEKRREVFGPERFCKPLNLLGSSIDDDGDDNDTHYDGALSRTALRIIQSGVFHHLQTFDPYGRGIFIFDREFIDPEHFEQLNDRTEALFYFLHVLSESEQILKNGFVMLVAAETKTVKCTPCAANFRLGASPPIPVWCKVVHIVSFGSPSLIQRSLNVWLSSLNTWKYLTMRLRMHCVGSAEELLKELQEFGLSSENLPKRYGGSVDHQVWMKQRIETERKRYNSHPPTVMEPMEKEAPASDNSTVDLGTEMSLHELKDRCEEMTEKCLVAKLEREKQALLTKHELLKSQLVCATYIGNQYDSDVAKIHFYLKNLFARVIPTQPEIPAEYIHDDRKLSALVDDVMQYYLLYLGRDSVTHQFMFLRTEFPMPDAVRREMDQLQRSLPGMTTQILEGRTQFHQQQSREDGTNEADGSTEDPVDLEISSLRREIQTLERRNSLLRRDQSFLESSKVFVDHSVENFNQYREQNRGYLTNHLARTLSLRQSNTSALADWLLARLTWFWGQTTITPSLTVAHMLAQNVAAAARQGDGTLLSPGSAVTTPGGNQEGAGQPNGQISPKGGTISPSGRNERRQRVHRRRRKNLKRL
mmetsp:Transcript_7607/g.15604  ORF Transcript_7607/g.15604 Transcript_7607/m.15604 type:complete len:777 (+) Transcript_7607:77-2407(+)